MCGREGFRTCIIEMLRNQTVEGEKKLVCGKWLRVIETVASLEGSIKLCELYRDKRY